MNQHRTPGINQAGERQARQGMEETAGQAQTLRKTGRRKPARKYPLLSVCGIFSISQRAGKEGRKPCAVCVCGLSADGLRTNGGALPYADHRGRGVCDQKRRRTNADPCPLYASSPRRRKRRRAHGAGISGARPGRGVVFTCPRPIYLYIES